MPPITPPRPPQIAPFPHWKPRSWGGVPGWVLEGAEWKLGGVRGSGGGQVETGGSGGSSKRSRDPKDPPGAPKPPQNPPRPPQIAPFPHWKPRSWGGVPEWVLEGAEWKLGGGQVETGGSGGSPNAPGPPKPPQNPPRAPPKEPHFPIGNPGVGEGGPRMDFYGGGGRRQGVTVVCRPPPSSMTLWGPHGGFWGALSAFWVHFGVPKRPWAPFGDNCAPR